MQHIFIPLRLLNFATATSWPRVWVAQGQEGGGVICSQPMPCSIASTSHMGLLPWSTPMRTEWGWHHEIHSPLLSVPEPHQGCSSTGWHPWWCCPAMSTRASLNASHGIGSCPCGRGVRATWDDKPHGYLHIPGSTLHHITVPACALKQEQNPGSPSKQQGNTSLFCDPRAQKASDNPIQTIPLDKNANNFMRRRSS